VDTGICTASLTINSEINLTCSGVFISDYEQKVKIMEGLGLTILAVAAALVLLPVAFYDVV